MDNQNINTGITSTKASNWYNLNGEAKSDDYPQLSSKYNSLTDIEKKELIGDVISAIKGISGPDKEMSVNLQLCHWFRIDMGLGMAVANGLNINLQEMMKQMQG